MTGAQRLATYSSFEAGLSPGPAKGRRASPYQPLKPNMLRPVRQLKRRNGQGAYFRTPPKKISSKSEYFSTATVPFN
jgi:hypothetical protein